MKFSACLQQKPRKFITFITCASLLCTLICFLCKLPDYVFNLLLQAVTITNTQSKHSNMTSSHASQHVYYPRGLSEVPFRTPCQSQICEVCINIFLSSLQRFHDGKGVWMLSKENSSWLKIVGYWTVRNSNPNVSAAQHKTVINPAC